MRKNWLATTRRSGWEMCADKEDEKKKEKENTTQKELRSAHAFIRTAGV